jgi:hypothetical protein
MIKNCKVCQHYQCEEIGDSDYGAIYAAEPSCSKYKDMDENEDEIKGFDREAERECCVLDCFKVAEIDEEIGNLFNEDGDEVTFGDKAYKRFNEKYC